MTKGGLFAYLRAYLTNITPYKLFIRLFFVEKQKLVVHPHKNVQRVFSYLYWEFWHALNLQDLWMSEGELVDMLHVTAMKLHAVIRSIYKDGLLTVSEVQQKQETSNGIWQTLYGFPMIVALCFRINSYGAARFRATIFKRLYGAKEKSSVIILQLNRRTTAFSWMSSCLFVGLALSYCRE